MILCSNQKPDGTRKAILDALGEGDSEEEISIRPTLPLVGSLNVNINNKEENGYE